MTDVRRFLRGNIVLVAAFVLPAIVAVLFILATVIPNWTVPPPQHDLVVRVEQPYASPPPDVSVEFAVRDGQVEAIVRPVVRPDPSIGVPYTQRWALLLFDHTAMRVREIPVDVPRSVPQGETRIVAIDALAGRHVTGGDTAPDGYRVASLSGYGGGGIVGELFGMNRRYRPGISIGKDGRTIPLELPARYRDVYGVIVPIGWIRDDGGR
jgi:hypothetical protein